MRIGLVGAGRRSRILAASIPSDQQVAAVSSKQMTSAKCLAGELNCDAMTTEDMVNNTEIDCFLVAVPISELNATAVSLIATGRPIFLEKPGLTDKDLTNRLMQIVSERMQVVRVGFSWLEEQWTQNILQGAATIKVEWSKPVRKLGSLPSLNLTTHPIAWLVANIGTPISVTRLRYYDRDYVSLRWKNSGREVVAQVFVTWGKQVDSKRIIQVRYPHQEDFVYEDGGVPQIQHGVMTSAQIQLQDFFDDVTTGKFWNVNDLSLTSHVLTVLGKQI